MAFGIEAWWDGLQEQQEVRESLAALRGEFERNRTLLEDALDSNELRLEGIAVAMALTPTEVSNLSRDSAGVLFVHLSTHGSFNPSSGAIDAVLSTNVLDNVRDTDLRRQIAAWPGRLVPPNRQLVSVLETGDQLGRRWAELGRGGDPEGWRNERDPFACALDLRAFLGDPLHRGLAANRMVLLAAYNNQLRRLEEPIENMLSLLPAPE